MTFHVTESETQMVLVVAGAIRIHSSTEFRTALLDLLNNSGGRQVVADLSDVEYVDSSGLAVLVEGLKAAKKQQVSFLLRGVRDNVRYLLEITRLLPLFQLEEQAGKA